MSVQQSSLQLLAKTTLSQVWLAFSAVICLGISWSSALDPSSLLSDDPYLFCFVFAFVAAGLAVIHASATSFKPLALLKHRILAAALLVWCGALAIWEYVAEHEWDGFGYLFAIGSVISGIVAWITCTCPLPSWVRRLISVIAVATLIAYGCVLARMNAGM